MLTSLVPKTVCVEVVDVFNHTEKVRVSVPIIPIEEPASIYCELAESNSILKLFAINGEAVTLKLKLELTPLTVYVIVYACIVEFSKSIVPVEALILSPDGVALNVPPGLPVIVGVGSASS